MSNSIATQVLLLPAFVLVALNGCKENPASQQPEPKPNVLTGGQFHGTWYYIGTEPDSLKISFDSTRMKFISLVRYDFGMFREYPGTFVVTDSTLFLTYNGGSTDAYPYRFSDNKLILGKTPSSTRQLTRIMAAPSHNGWTTKIQIMSEYTISYVQASILSYSSSDSGAIALAAMGSDYQRYFLRIDIAGVTTLGLASGVRAIDARGPYLWAATDSSIYKRAISSPTIISSFNYRNLAGFDCQATGLAVDSSCCFLMTYEFANHRGMLLKCTLDGTLLSSIQTATGFKDLCLINGRLFCLSGDQMFHEIDTATGQVITNYELHDRPSGNNLNGMALIGSTIQFPGINSEGFLRLTNVWIP